MNPREGIALALAQIRAQKLKSFFAVLGVIIGVMFLIAVVSVVEGMNRYITEDFARQVYGLNTITVRRVPEINFAGPSEWREWQRRPRLRFEDADAIHEQLGLPALVAVESDADAVLEAEDGTEVKNVWLSGASADYFRIMEHEIARGRLFTPPEDRFGIPVVVLGHEAAEKLFGSRDPLGRRVRINGFPFRVIGVLEQEGSLFGFSLDRRAIAPAHSPVARMVNPHGIVDRIVVRVSDAQLIPLAKLRLEAIMRSRRGLRPNDGNNFVIETSDEGLSFWARISRILYIAFPGLVSIALVVGGIVIMNIMLVSVVERTREIGVRKAIGARRRDIILQVLVESATLSGLGAILGIAIGIGLAWLVRALSPLPAVIAPQWIAAAVLLGVGVGMIAGIYPAARAAALDPVVALRHE